MSFCRPCWGRVVIEVSEMGYGAGRRRPAEAPRGRLGMRPETINRVLGMERKGATGKLRQGACYVSPTPVTLSHSRFQESWVLGGVVCCGKESWVGKNRISCTFTCLP